VEMTVRGKPGKPKTGFPPFPPPLEIPRNRRDSHISTASAVVLYLQAKLKTCPENINPRVGQNKCQVDRIMLKHRCLSSENQLPCCMCICFEQRMWITSSAPKALQLTRD
jgi:hypothetical protein